MKTYIVKDSEIPGVVSILHVGTIFTSARSTHFNTESSFEPFHLVEEVNGIRYHGALWIRFACAREITPTISGHSDRSSVNVS